MALDTLLHLELIMLSHAAGEFDGEFDSKAAGQDSYAASDV